ncbi:MAG: thiamine diphosphokinase [Peptococcaceae bacterium]|nr:thiamine diphosphokinase [Peptococcaceae bacterium]
MKIAVLANGDWDPVWGVEELHTVDYLICADGGANAALEAQRLPDLLIGDLDSVRASTLRICREQGVGIQEYPTRKDETDLELALLRAEEKLRYTGSPCPEIWLYGATGGRTDHLLGNLTLAVAYARRGVALRFKDPNQEIRLIHTRTEISGNVGQQISLLPCWGEAAWVSTQGLAYVLDHEELLPDRVRGISNVFTAQTCVIDVHQGTLWVIHHYAQKI